MPIINGPDKWGIISSFANRTSVEFKTEGKKFSGIISSIEHEDGSKESFNIILQTTGGNLMIYYHSEKKRGKLRFLKK